MEICAPFIENSAIEAFSKPKIGLSHANINCFEYKILVDIDLASKTVLSLEFRKQRMVAEWNLAKKRKYLVWQTDENKAKSSVINVNCYSCYFFYGRS
jgi:hypothetical protein